MGESDKLVKADKNGDWDVFLRDRATGRTEWISRRRAGTTNDDLSTNPDVSADGRFVVFESNASEHGVGRQGRFQGHLHSRSEHREDASDQPWRLWGAEADGNSLRPVISADGRFVAFHSDATNLVTGGTSGTQVFRYDRVRRLMRVVSVAPGGAAVGGSDAAISATGRFVAFESTVTDLVAGGTNGKRHVFVRKDPPRE